MDGQIQEFCTWLEACYRTKVPPVLFWDSPLPLFGGQLRVAGKILVGKLTETPEIWVYRGTEYDNLLILAHEFHHYLRKLQGFRDPTLNDPQDGMLELEIDCLALADLVCFMGGLE